MHATILIAEGHASLRWVLHRWLETRFPDYHFIEVNSVTKAVSMAQARSPAVIIIDIGLSEMSYLKALEQIRLMAPAVQIVVLTNSEEEEIQGIRATGTEPSIYFLWKDNILTELEPILTRLLLRVQNRAIRPQLERLLVKQS